jgi:hypothetical protein
MNPKLFKFDCVHATAFQAAQDIMNKKTKKDEGLGMPELPLRQAAPATSPKQGRSTCNLQL